MSDNMSSPVTREMLETLKAQVRTESSIRKQLDLAKKAGLDVEADRQKFEEAMTQAKAIIAAYDGQV